MVTEDLTEEETLPEAEPTDGYEWDEGVDPLPGNLIDGMGSLAVNPNGAGYFGIASGAALLRIVR